MLESWKHRKLCLIPQSCMNSTTKMENQIGNKMEHEMESELV